jgi:chromosome partitioning protein
VKVLALYNLKGGVGKTTTAVHVAHLLAHGGLPTLLWDLDPQGAASWWFRVRPVEARAPRRVLRDREQLWSGIRGSDWPLLDILPADLSQRALESVLRREDAPGAVLRAALDDLGARYERVVLDCPPALNLLAECVFEAADALIVPAIPTALSLRTLAELHRHLKPHRKRGLRLLPFFSMVDPRKALHRRVRAFARGEALGFLAAEIPYSAHVENAAARRAPLTADPLDAARAPAAAFAALTAEVEQRLAAEGDAPRLGRGRLEELLRALRDG